MTRHVFLAVSLFEIGPYSVVTRVSPNMKY